MSEAVAPALALDHITRVFGEGEGRSLEIFRDVSLSIAPGEIVGLVGPSGSGKSSLLHIAGLLEAPTAGEVWIGGRPTCGLGDADRTAIRRDELGFVYQFHHLLPEFTALENVAMPRRIAGHARQEAEAEAARLLNLVGLAERMTHRPAQLSGGERQRVAIARALANGPRVLLADEPTGNLDPRTADHVFRVLIDALAREGRAALVATHNLELAQRMSRVVMLNAGRLLQAEPATP